MDKKIFLKKKRINDAGIYESALQKKDWKLCQNISDFYTRDLCYRELSAKLLNASICRLIKNFSEQKICYFVVYKKLAQKNKDINFCRKIENKNLSRRCLEEVKKTNFCSTEECFNNISGQY